ncbi:ZrgA family zinc uptake protein [Pseudomonas sp. HK3]
MSKHFISITCVFVLYSVIVLSVYTQERGPILKAHDHGLSELTIFLENRKIEIQLTSPVMDIIGFEHKENTKEEIITVERVTSKLQKHDSLFLFIGTFCQHLTTFIDTDYLIESKPNNHEKITADYQYECDNQESLDSIKIGLFELLPNIKKIRVTWVKHKTQNSETTFIKNPIVYFGSIN